MPPPPFQLLLPPKQEGATLFAAPHSGRIYDEGFVSRSNLAPNLLRSSEDAFVDLLFSDIPPLGAPLLVAQTPRAYVDLNRAADELDPALIEGLKKRLLNPRIASGLGVIPRVVAGGRVIHAGRLSMEEAESRLAQGWHPYHRQLAQMIAQTHRQFGAALLIDCHSMPREALEPGPDRPDIVLGDRYGSSCAAEVIAQIEAALQAQGFRTRRNHPFAGAYILQQYGRPSIGQHAVQLEIDRSLYMDEQSLTPHAGFDDLRRRLAAAAADMIAIGRDLGRKTALAAE